MPSRAMNSKIKSKDHCFTYFKSSITDIELPLKFTFPFHYEPHQIGILAAEELQEHIRTQTDWDYDFGLNQEKESLRIGKMFGVLVVRNQQGELGYLSAFSGKLADKNHHPNFVPPVFDTLISDGVLSQGMEILSKINSRVSELEKDPSYLSGIETLLSVKQQRVTDMNELKQVMKDTKAMRKAKRYAAKSIMSIEDFKELEKLLSQESISEKIKLKYFTEHWDSKLAECQEIVNKYQIEIDALKEQRKTKSASIQQELFNEYQFLNYRGQKKGLLDIFVETSPIAGAGECAAPKLLQYAYLHHLKPIALAEFWWGKAPKSAVRKHGNYYAACWSKCKPILTHMLEGLAVDDNPLIINYAFDKEIETIYEDEHLAVINKPVELLSEPGKYIEDSVATRMKIKYPDATGPMIVHRLDMATSGLLLIAKSLEVHKYLQRQFMRRTIKKRYIAVLDGVLPQNEGVIDLPLRVDFEDRPRQLVCYEHGRVAKTRYEVIHRTESQTRVYFYPITGRSHQLRVHAAHHLGLYMPIVGDELYGARAERLHLHAEYIEFNHPVTRETIICQKDPDF